jgi:hypothetical protein
VQLLNARLQRLRHSAFDGAREGFASVHVFVVAVGGRELIGSTDAVIAADLERGASATLDSHAALSEASRLLSKADFSSAFVHIAPDLDMNIPVLSCAPLAPRIVAGDAAAEQGWALCLQVPLDFYVSERAGRSQLLSEAVAVTVQEGRLGLSGAPDPVRRHRDLFGGHILQF